MQATSIAYFKINKFGLYIVFSFLSRILFTTHTIQCVLVLANISQHNIHERFSSWRLINPKFSTTVRFSYRFSLIYIGLLQNKSNLKTKLNFQETWPWSHGLKVALAMFVKVDTTHTDTRTHTQNCKRSHFQQRIFFPKVLFLSKMFSHNSQKINFSKMVPRSLYLLACRFSTIFHPWTL